MKAAAYFFAFSMAVCSSLVWGKIYKCTDGDGALRFSDQPCPSGVSQEEVSVRALNTNWIEKLKLRKPASVQIKTINRVGQEAEIAYQFASQKDSELFMQLVNQISHQSVYLVKYIQPTADKPGQAKISVSSKPNPNFDKYRKGAK